MQLYQLSFPGGKKYIGITSKTAKERFNAHCRYSYKKMGACQSAIKKYGKENVIITVLGECDDWELLCLAEMEAIEKYNTIAPNGYNLTLGGEGTVFIKEYGTERLNRDRRIRILYAQSNKEKIKLRMTEYQQINKEKLNLISREYRIKNKEELDKKGKEYREKNKEKISIKGAKYYEARKEEIAKITKEYREKNRAKLRENGKAYRDKNRELILAKAKEKYNNNRELYISRQKEYYQKNKVEIIKQKKDSRLVNKKAALL